MTVKATCLVGHEPVGSSAGATVGVFADWDEAMSSGLGERYPNCVIWYEEDGK